MKLKSKEIFPTEARDKLIDKLGGVDNGISDMRLALETAEQQCFDLNEKNRDLISIAKAFENNAIKHQKLLNECMIEWRKIII